MSSESESDNITNSGSQDSRHTLRPDPSPSTPSHLQSSTMSGSVDAETIILFGSKIQKFAQKVTATLSWYTISDSLTDSNFNDWVHPISEALQTLGYDQYLSDSGYLDNSLSTVKEARLKLIITTWVLSHMDATHARQTRNHLTIYSHGAASIDYCPFRLWRYINQYHCTISKSRLSVVSKIFHELKQPQGDTVTKYLDTFETVLAEYQNFGGNLDESQIARQLISSLKPGYEVTIAIIYRTVDSLTFEKVASILQETDSEAGLSESPAIQACLATQSDQQSNRRAFPPSKTQMH